MNWAGLVSSALPVAVHQAGWVNWAGLVSSALPVAVHHPGWVDWAGLVSSALPVAVHPVRWAVLVRSWWGWICVVVCGCVATGHYRKWPMCSCSLFTGTATRTHSPFIGADGAERAHPSVILCSALCATCVCCCHYIGKPLEQNGGHGMLEILVMGENQQLHFVSMLCFPSDASLTLPKVLAAVRTVDVGRLEIVLQVPLPKKDEVEQQSASFEERKVGLVKYYVDASPNASWEDLGRRLLSWEEEAAMEEVKVHIKPTQGEYGVSIDMCQCFTSWLGQ